MVTTANIDLSSVFEAHLSYEFRIENADLDEFLRISVSSDGGTTFFDVKEYVGSESVPAWAWQHRAAHHSAPRLRRCARCELGADHDG